MMKSACVGAFALALLFSVSGCAELDRLIAPTSTPAPSFASLRAGATALVCGLSSAAALAGRIEDAVNAGEAAVSTTGQVYVTSALVCGALGGTVANTSVLK